MIVFFNETYNCLECGHEKQDRKEQSSKQLIEISVSLPIAIGNSWTFKRNDVRFVKKLENI